MDRKLSGVGYKRPPKEHSWKKDECGNPKGRPPGHRNLASALTAVPHENVSVPVDGDPRLISELLAEIHKNETQAERDASLEPQGEINREVLDAFYARLRSEATKGE
jgi:hypothetical protein